MKSMRVTELKRDEACQLPKKPKNFMTIFVLGFFSRSTGKKKKKKEAGKKKKRGHIFLSDVGAYAYALAIVIC